MSRLPVVGGDANTWGAVLNDFLFAATLQSATFSRSGVLSITSGAGRFVMPAAATIAGVVASVNVAPTGSAIICDVNKNGVSIFTVQANRPSIAAGANQTASAAVPAITACVADDYLTVDIDQVGSTVAGSDLVVQVFYRIP